ncbi:hypothetical protein Q8F55_004868 [Vanrija albida]|uniref:Uncharacterized protein n=1 Tax=Vanrija albida TaxID=181172 RepID=A0ABR3Q033_9TREE
MSANQLTFVGLETVKFDDDDVGGYQVPAPNPDSGVAPQSHDASACQAANLYLERWVKRRHRSATFLTISQYLDDKESRPFEIADGD